MNKKLIWFIFSFFILLLFPLEKSWPATQAYNGPIYNIFFHPLIVYPERAFYRGNVNLNFIDQWFITTNEFKKTLPELYKRGFILVSPKDVFEEKKDAQGKLIFLRKNLILPAGKKPLILSLDDYNFYKTMKLNGTVHRFWVNEQNQLVTETKAKDGSLIIRDDQEIPQLLENFIAEHPDFSYHNARGIIALTGYNGIFGYTTQLSNSDYPKQLSEAKAVVNKLKEMGWEFASHSYFHLSEDQQKEKAFEASEKLWQKQVGSIVGSTSFYIFPFGDSWYENKVRMRFLKSLGYKYFFGVSTKNGLLTQPGAIIMLRFPLDGNALRGEYPGTDNFATPARILDPARIKK